MYLCNIKQNETLTNQKSKIMKTTSEIIDGIINDVKFYISIHLESHGTWKITSKFSIEEKTTDCFGDEVTEVNDVKFSVTTHDEELYEDYKYADCKTCQEEAEARVLEAWWDANLEKVADRIAEATDSDYGEVRRMLSNKLYED